MTGVGACRHGANSGQHRLRHVTLTLAAAAVLSQEHGVAEGEVGGGVDDRRSIVVNSIDVHVVTTLTTLLSTITG